MGTRSSKTRVTSVLDEIHQNLTRNLPDNPEYAVSCILSHWLRETDRILSDVIPIIQNYVAEEIGQILQYKDSIKVVLVGSRLVGKTALLWTYCNGYFDENYYYIFDQHTVSKQVGSYQVDIDLWDTMAHEDYERLRPLSYPKTDVFILCFSISDKQSISREEIITKWIPELRKEVHLHEWRWDIDIPIILCGTKIDLRQSNAERTFGDELVEQIGALEYVECSSLREHGVDYVFERAVIAAIMHRERKKLNAMNRKSGFMHRFKTKKS